MVTLISNSKENKNKIKLTQCRQPLVLLSIFRSFNLSLTQDKRRGLVWEYSFRVLTYSHAGAQT